MHGGTQYDPISGGNRNEFATIGPERSRPRDEAVETDDGELSHEEKSPKKGRT